MLYQNTVKKMQQINMPILSNILVLRELLRLIKAWHVNGGAVSFPRIHRHMRSTAHCARIVTLRGSGLQIKISYNWLQLRVVPPWQ